jgi:hypothetical protein
LNGEAFLTIPVNTGGLIKEKAKICMTSSNPSVGLSAYVACAENQFAQIWRSKTKRKTLPLLTLNGIKQETIRRQL